jgi:hypothetical protein
MQQPSAWSKAAVLLRHPAPFVSVLIASQRHVAGFRNAEGNGQKVRKCGKSAEVRSYFWWSLLNTLLIL